MYVSVSDISKMKNEFSGESSVNKMTPSGDLGAISNRAPEKPTIPQIIRPHNHIKPSLEPLNLPIVPSSNLPSKPNAIPTTAIQQRVLPNHLLMVSLLEHICHMYAGDPGTAQLVFKSRDT